MTGSKNQNHRSSEFTAELVGTAQVSPASTVAFSWDNLPKACQKASFRLITARFQFASLDVATANKVLAGPSIVQIRQQDSASQSSTSSGTTIKSSPLVMVGPQPKVVNFRGVNHLYPEGYRGSNFLAVDCLCPKSGYEIGALFTYQLKFCVYHTSQNEACPALKEIPLRTDLLSADVCVSPQQHSGYEPTYDG